MPSGRRAVFARERIKKMFVVDPDSNCWLWTGVLNKKGYGSFYVRETGGKYVSLRAHRAMYQMFIGPIPDGKFVCHTCDIPSCVNPAHLFIGTHKENMSDMVKKGRQHRPIGEKSNFSKLTEQQVREIFRETGSQRAIAKKYGISKGTVAFIKHRQTWAHLDLER